MTRTRSFSLLPIALLSGAAALAYETLWARLAAFAFGADAPAEAAVLAATMAGLGIGAILSTPVAARAGPRRALRLFALLEAAAALYTLLLPAILQATSELLASAGAEGAGLAWLRAINAFLVISPATTLLGAGFPPLAAAITGRTRHAGKAASALYVVNLSGAVLGAALASLVLLPILGARFALGAAAALGIGAAVLAFVLAPAESAAPPAETSDPADPGGGGGLVLLMAVGALLGARTLALEVAALRTLRLCIGGGVQAFAITLIIFLLGLAIGAWISRLLLRWGPRRAAIAAELATIVGIGLTLRLVPGMQDAFLEDAIAAARAPSGGLAGIRLAAAARLLLPLAIPCGIATPLLLRLAGQGAKALRRASWIYAANAIGCLLGALLGALVLIPGIGLQSTFLVAAAASAVTALALAAPGRGALALTAVGAIVGAGVALTEPWPTAALTRGVYADPTPGQEREAETELRFLQIGLSATVSVEDDVKNNARILKTDGKIEGAVPIDGRKPSTADLTTPLALAAFPTILAAREPKRVCVIGLGTGVTAGALLTYPLDSLDIIEIEPAIVEALRHPDALFDVANNKPLEDPKASIYTVDACAFLKNADRSYDLITCQPSDPWLSSASILLTRDFYRRVRARLAPDGVYCQWFQLYALDRDALRAGVATFLDVFPEAIALNPPGSAEILLLGGLKGLDRNELEIRLRARAAQNAKLTTNSQDILACFVAGPKGLADFAGDAPIETVDHPRLAYRAASLLYTSLERAQTLLDGLLLGAGELGELLQGGPQLRAEVLLDCAEVAGRRGRLAAARIWAEQAGALHPPLKGKTLRILGDLALKQRKLELARRYWNEAIAIDPEAVLPRISIATMHLSQGERDQAIAILTPGLTGEPRHDGPLNLLLGRAYEGKKDLESAYQAYRKAGRYGGGEERARLVKQLQEDREPKAPPGPVERDPKLLARAARKRASEKQWSQALSLLKKAITLAPKDPDLRYQAARTLRDAGRLKPALGQAEEAIKLQQESQRHRRLRARILEDLGRWDEAADAWRALLDLEPDELRSTPYRLGLAGSLIALDRSKEALDQLDRAARLAPESPQLFRLTGDALRRLGRVDQARAAYLRYIDLAPRNDPGAVQARQWLLQNPP